MLTPTSAGRSHVVGHNKDADVVHPDMNLEIDLGLDSLSRAETFAALEHAFSTEFIGDEAAKSLTVRDAAALIESHVGNANSLEPVSTDLNWSTILTEPGMDVPEVLPIQNTSRSSSVRVSCYKVSTSF